MKYTYQGYKVCYKHILAFLLPTLGGGATRVVSFIREIILFEAAAREIKKAGLTKLPSSEKLKAQLDGLAARKTALQTELLKIQREEKEVDQIQKNIGIILNVQKQKEKSEPELF